MKTARPERPTRPRGINPAAWAEYNAAIAALPLERKAPDARMVRVAAFDPAPMRPRYR